ncbi:MAG: metallophosphoesterase [Bacteroidia bacterium]
MSRILIGLIFFLIVVLIEYYFLQAVKTFSQDFSPTKKNVVNYSAYTLSAITLLTGLVSVFYPPPEWNSFFRFVSSVVLMFSICKVLGFAVMFLEDISRALRWVFAYFFTDQKLSEEGIKINRLKFISQVAVTLTVIPAVSFFYGMVRGAYKYRVHNAKISSPNLPEAFDGFKIVQISDIHCGSFLSDAALIKAFDILHKQKPDLILFTGDLVNNIATETHDYIEQYKSLKAPYGVYSVLGNHDYGDYVSWESGEAKRANLDSLKKIQADCGWKLLMNEHVALEKDGEKIALIGIENWSASNRFPKKGRLDLAYKGAEQYPFKILMSHDPSHWDQQVRKDYPNIDLTLSGHTHGMQFGIEIPGFKWSPVQYLYKQWAGLYKQDNQYLYVNRGLGFLGYPGRLGIWPEITVLELKKA